MRKSPVKLAPVKLAPTKEVTQVCFVIDRSQSMQNLRDKVVEVFNAQAEDHRVQAKKFNQETRFSLITFSDFVDDPVFFDEPVSSLGNLTRASYNPDGMTALYAATHSAIKQLERTQANAYLLIVITDGGENYSQHSGVKANDVARLIQKVNSTDKWTISFMVPPNASFPTLTAMGLYSRNIQKWEATDRGIEEANNILRGSTQSYYQQRAVGQTRSRDFFKPDVSNLNTRAVKSALTDVTKTYHAFQVFQDVDIRACVESYGMSYVKGNAFYQLTKKETVQGHKDFCLRSKKDGKIYKGDYEARNLLGIPTGGTIELYPAQSTDYDIFVQSTSFNRKLIAGTTLLYRVR